MTGDNLDLDIIHAAPLPYVWLSGSPIQCHGYKIFSSRERAAIVMTGRPPGSPVTVRVEQDENHVRIDISDVGIGIAPEALNRIFEMFTQVGREAKNSHTGLGIGPNLARRLVEMHDGQLVAMSEGLGKGSHFVVTLPLFAPSDREPAPESPTASAPSPAMRALIVDDNVDAAASLSLLLQLGGHSICTAHNGADALKLAPEFKPDVVLLDIGMPGMDGYEVARALRANPEVGHPVLVAVTGWGDAEDRLKSKAAGFDEHLTKPVDISMIELLFATLAAREASVGGSPHPWPRERPHRYLNLGPLGAGRPRNLWQNHPDGFKM